MSSNVMKNTAYTFMAAATLGLGGCAKDDAKKDSDSTTLPNTYEYGVMFVAGDTEDNSPARAITHSLYPGSHGHFTTSRAAQGTNYADVTALALMVKDTTLTPFKDINTQTGGLQIYMPKGVSSVFTDMKDNHVTLTAVSKENTYLQFQSNNPDVAKNRKALRASLSQTLLNSSKKIDPTTTNQPNTYSFNYQPN